MKILNGMTLTGNAIINANNLTVGTTQLIAANGNIGIGVTSPISPLHVNGILTLTGSAGSPTGNQSYVFQNSSTTADYGLNLRHYNNSIKDAEISIGGSTSAGTIYFLTNTLGNTATERMVVTADGRVGIGTVNPTTTLQVAGTITAPTFSGALSGNATTATALQTARTINLVSFNGSANITLTKLYSIDDRTLAPADTNTRYLEFGFGAWNNNGVSPFADFLNMRSYSDSSGGNDNVLMLRKDAIGMRIYQQSFGSTTAYASYRDVAFTDSPTFTGQVAVAGGISLSGTLTFNGSTGSSGQVLTSQGSSAPVWSSAGTGTVTSVAMTVPTILSVSGTPVTTSGTFALSLANQNANLVFAGPATGAATTPTFRSLVSADIPNLGASYLPLTGGTVTGNTSIVGTFAQGSTSSATGTYSAAFGVSVLSGGSASFVEGVSNAAMSEAAHAEGKFNLAVHGGEYTITARDNVGKAVALSSTAGLTAGDTLHFYVINGAPITGLTISSIAGSTVYLNGNPNITAFWNMAVERSTVQVPVHVEGYNNFVSGYASHAEGYRTKSIGDYGAHTEGSNTTASGDSSHAEGDSTIASDQSAHAEGYQTTASEFAAHAEGQQTIASGDTSHAQGYATIAGGWVSHAEGDSTAALTDRAHAEGMNTLAAQGALYTITAFNDTAKTITLDSVAGITTNNVLEIKRGNSQTTPITGVTVSSIAGNVVTLNTTATITSSWLYAIKKVANGVGGQHAEGAYSIATGIASHAQNNYTIASGDNSHSGGLGTIAQGQNQTVIGKYNVAQGTTNSLVDTDHAFIIGNGTSGSTRSNALSIDWNGGATFASNIYVNGLYIGKGLNNLSQNTAVGNSALSSITAGGNYNAAFGYFALKANTNGTDNTAVGNSALYNNTTGYENVAVGSNAMADNISGRDNTAVGTYSMQNGATPSFNTAVGYAALNSSNANYNIGIGYAAAQSITTGTNNTIIGSLNGTATLSNTVLIGAGTTERLKINSTGAYVNGSTNNLNDALAIAWLGL